MPYFVLATEKIDSRRNVSEQLVTIDTCAPLHTRQALFLIPAAALAAVVRTRETRWPSRQLPRCVSPSDTTVRFSDRVSQIATVRGALSGGAGIFIIWVFAIGVPRIICSSHSVS